MKCPSAQVFQLMLPKRPQDGSISSCPPEPHGKSCSALLIRMDTPKAVSPSFSLSLYPWTDLNDCHTTLQRRCPFSGVTLRKEAGGGNPATSRHGAQSTLQSSSSPETPPSFGGTRVGSAAGGSPGSGDCGLMQRGTGSPSPWRGGGGGGLFAWQTLPSALSSRTVPPGDPSLLRLQECDTSPGRQGQMGTEPAVLFSFLEKCF